MLKNTLNIIFVQFIADSLCILKRKTHKWVRVKENLSGDAEVSKTLVSIMILLSDIFLFMAYSAVCDYISVFLCRTFR